MSFWMYLLSMFGIIFIVSPFEVGLSLLEKHFVGIGIALLSLAISIRNKNIEVGKTSNNSESKPCQCPFCGKCF